MDVSAHRAALAKEGYTLFRSLYSPEFVQRCCNEIDRIHDALGRPELFAKSGRQLFDSHDVSVSSTGLNIAKFLKHAPTLLDGYFHDDVLAVLEATLGPGFRIETTGATVSDNRRPMQPWHTHVGGLDGDYRARDGSVQTLQQAREAPDGFVRLSFLMYLDGLSEDTGELLILPRAMTDNPACPFPGREREAWPGQVPVHGPAGTAVLVDEDIWHAGLPRRTAGLRRFVAAWLVAADAPSTRNKDDSVSAFEATALHRTRAA